LNANENYQKYYKSYITDKIMSSSIDWNDVTKKEARGSNDEDLGEVQEVGPNYVLVQKGMINKEKFYIPKDMAESYDGNVLHFRISKEDAESRYMTDSPPAPSTQERTTTPSSMPRQRQQQTEGQEETTVPLTEERLDVSKKASAREATITKEPMTETKSVEVPVTHEEISVERRQASGSSSSSTKADSPVQSRTETKVPLKSEEVQVTKQPYVKEEVSVKKKPVTETKTVTDQVTSEKVKVKGQAGEEEEI
jgi:uncharacterized protein (TIGR02271 family)